MDRIPGPQCAFKMSMFMCPAVYMATRILLRLSSTYEPSDPPLGVIVKLCCYHTDFISCQNLPLTTHSNKSGRRGRKVESSRPLSTTTIDWFTGRPEPFIYLSSCQSATLTICGITTVMFFNHLRNHVSDFFFNHLRNHLSDFFFLPFAEPS